jgi:para-aminobenzoate synthetase
VRTLIIDNYDSFTYNLVHLIADINQEEPLVIRNDALTWDELSGKRFDNIIVSPGPGRPDRTADFGLSKAAIEAAASPLLGVCLGHQGLAIASGASLEQAPTLVHGRASRIAHHGVGLLAGMPPLFNAARYHSFVVRRPLPATLEEIAWSEDGLVMGISRRDRPQWGVQFHPESILTENGRILLRNFRDLSFRASGKLSTPRSPARAGKRRATAPAAAARKAFWLEIPRAIDTEAVFCSLFADQPFAFWLDSNLDGSALSRWSYMGDASGPHAATAQYRCVDHTIVIDDARGRRIESADIFQYLQSEHPSRPQSAPPCPFVGGHVGWLGYELRHDCGSPTRRRAATPDALLIRSDRFIAVNHLEAKTYVCALDSPDEADRAQHWIHATLRQIESANTPPVDLPHAIDRPLEFRMRDGKASYLSKVAGCLELIAQGETYQVCLTNELSCAATVEPLRVYRTMRRVNPAPFAAFLKWPGGSALSASPERFLAVDADGNIEAKPIKGTVRRDADPLQDKGLVDMLRASRKNRAENGMIVDLLRHDLSRCCETGTVSVPSLFDVETYRTVHQLVSTVRGVLNPEHTLIDVLRSGAFPGGSMTGAPKHRTLEHIDQLEQRARGIYSGALGWLGDDGAADLSIVIRSIVSVDGQFLIGVGGGVVAESTPEEEFEEMLLKAEASIKAIVIAAFGSFSEGHYHLLDSSDD